MNHQVSVETAVCTEHQRLLTECQRALEIWNEHRAEFCQFRFNAREAGDELLRLQAKYARNYTVLQNHERNCSLCQAVSRIDGLDTQLDNEMFTRATIFLGLTARLSHRWRIISRCSR